MRYFSVLLLVYAVIFIAGCTDRIESPPSTAKVSKSPWVLNDVDSKVIDPEGQTLFASCASCHLADGRGRSDGLVPSLAGQNKAILVHKLQALRDGKVTLPVMLPFANALLASEIEKVAAYIAALPKLETDSLFVVQTQTLDDYSFNCAACHGASAEGNDVLLAPKLCAQHAPYLIRRMNEIERNVRGDGHPGMRAIIGGLSLAQRADIASWLASGQCADLLVLNNQVGEI
jgi:cytochrome c553